MELIALLAFGGYIYSIYVSFRKGKKVFGWLGIGAAILPLAPFLIWFPLVGSLRRAKPESAWTTMTGLAGQPSEPTRTATRISANKPAVPAPTEDQTAEREIIDEFLARATAAGVLRGSLRDRLLEFLYEPARTAPAQMTGTPTKAFLQPKQVPAAAPERIRPAAPRPAPKAPPPITTQPISHPARRPVPTRRPNPIAVHLREKWDAVSSEIALHGLAYLGVLLTFVGVLGFLLFAFQDVPNEQQPAVELFIAVVFFGWAWALCRQQAVNVATAMELLGGMILPLVLFAGFVDEAPVPPDFTGRPLVAVLTLSPLVLAFLYALAAKRRPTTPLRFLVMPLTWLSAMAFGFAFKTDEPMEGLAITRLLAIQPALAAAAISFSMAPLTRRRLADRSIPVVIPAAVAAPLVYLLTIALSVGQSGLMSLSASVAGVATIASVHFLANHFGQPRLARLATPLLLAGAIVPLAPQAGIGWAGLIGVAGYLALVEWTAKHTPEDLWAWLLSGVGLVGALGMTVTEPTAALLGFGVALLWLQWRRGTSLPLAVDGVDQWLIAGTVLAPFGFGWGLWNLMDPDVALLIMAALVAAVAVTARVRAPSDTFWSLWPAGFALVIGGLVVAGAANAFPDTGPSSDLLPIATLVVVAATIGAGHGWLELRLWLTSAILATDLYLLLDAYSAPPSIQAIAWAGLGVTLVAASLLRTDPGWDHPAAIGHTLGTAALWVGGGPEAAAVTLSLWAVGWLLSMIATERDRGSVTRLLQRTISASGPNLSPALPNAISWLVPVIFAASLPVAMLASLNLWGQFEVNRSWTGVSLAFLSILVAASTRLISKQAPARLVLSFAALVNMVLGVAIAAPVPWPTILAAGASTVVAFTLASDVRHAAANWFSWAMSGVLVTLLAERLGVADEHLYAVVLAWGIVTFVGGLLTDDAIAGRRQRGDGLRVEWTRFPVLLGALAVPASLAPNFALGSTAATWSALGAAAGYGAVSWLLRSPLPLVPAYALATFGFVSLLPTSAAEEPLWLSAATASLVGAYLITRSLTQHDSGSDFWSSWDLPSLVVAHGVGILTLVYASTGTQPAPWVLMGGLSVAMAVSRHNRAWLDAGHILILVGLSFVNLGVLAAGLAVTSLRAVVEAYRLRGPSRLVAQAVAALTAAGAWALLAVWADWDLAFIVSSTAMLAGSVGLIGAASARAGLLQADSAIAWTAWAASGIGFATVAGLSMEQSSQATAIDGPWLAIGLALFAAATHLLGRVLDEKIRLVAVALAGLAWLALAIAMGWSVETTIVATALLGGTVSMVAVESHRLADRAPTNDALAVVWGGLGVLFVVIAALAATDLELERAWAWGIAPGGFMASLAAGRGADRLPLGGLREASSLGLLASMAVLVHGLGGSDGHLVAMMLSLGVLSSVLLVRRGPDRSMVWVRPIELLVVAANAVAVAVAVSNPPATETVTAVLLTAGIEAALVGIARRQVALVSLSPPLLAGAFVMLISDSALGSVQWYTLPLALVVLIEVEIVRTMWPDAEAAFADSLKTLEWVGIALAVLPAAVEMLVRSLAAAGILLLVSVSLLLWAILTRLRRRAIAAAGVAAGSSVLVISAALAGQAPESAGLWIIAAGLGFSVMAVAGVVEAAQSRRGNVVRRIDELMGDWQ